MFTWLVHFNLLCAFLFTAFYLYRIRYFITTYKFWEKDVTVRPAEKLSRLAVLISARNEENVIGQLLTSIYAQDYPNTLYEVFVIADNCTDNTAMVARSKGAHVLERFNTTQVGKGYALNFAYQKIQTMYPKHYFDAYMVFDADNLLEPNFFTAMNRTFTVGNPIVTSFRNSKNYGTNWISSGYALWFMYEGIFLNYPRTLLNRSCTISGTGFLVADSVLAENGGWPFHLLTEDVEFSVNSVLQGYKISFCRDAVLYDEQPDTFKTSWRQRMRWCKGFYQVFANYGGRLSDALVFNGSNYKNSRTIYYDIFFTLAPAAIISLLSLFGTLGLWGLSFIPELLPPLEAVKVQAAAPFMLMNSFIGYYLILFVMGVLTLLKCRTMIYARRWEKIISAFTFPLFMYTYLPIALVALFKKVEWKPIRHSVAKSIDEVRT